MTTECATHKSQRQQPAVLSFKYQRMEPSALLHHYQSSIHWQLSRNILTTYMCVCRGTNTRGISGMYVQYITWKMKVHCTN